MLFETSYSCNIVVSSVRRAFYEMLVLVTLTETELYIQLNFSKRILHEDCKKGVHRDIRIYKYVCASAALKSR